LTLRKACGPTHQRTRNQSCQDSPHGHRQN
jgi:hypothetical protein